MVKWLKPKHQCVRLSKRNKKILGAAKETQVMAISLYDIQMAVCDQFFFGFHLCLW